MPDAVVIGAGPNGLVAANLLADRGWDVVVLEAQDVPGGAVKSAELVEPGFVNDVFSAFYPLGVASPVLRDLDLGAFGLRWMRAPLALAHPSTDGTCAVLSMDIDETAAALDRHTPGDGDGWRRLYGRWERMGGPLLDCVLRPFPPVRGSLKLLGAQRLSDLGDLTRFLTLSVRRLGEETFAGEEGRRLLAGCALHTDLFPESPIGGMVGWMLAALGQDVGWPVPEGGAGRLTDALVARLQSAGGRIECSSPVGSVVVRGRRAVAVRTAAGVEIDATRAVVADVAAPALFLDLVGPDHLPAGFAQAVRHFEWDHATVKLDWALDGPIPWEADDARRAGTVHVSASVDALTVQAAQLAVGLVPDPLFLIVGQQGLADPSRAPAGKQVAWAYTHVPQHVRGDAGGSAITGVWDAAEADAMADRVEAEIELLAPGFRSLIRGRHVLTPRSMEAADANLVGGATNGGTGQLHQQLVFRPVAGLGRAETPVRGLYLGSASAHPGGGVHGACGANAARAALLGDRLRLGRTRRA